MTSNITFVIFTKNEEKRISYVVRNFIKYGEVILMDGGSTDKTQEIAEKLGAKFFVRPPSEKIEAETQENFEFVKSKIKTDWIFWGYVDNLAPKSLVEKMVTISEQDKYKYVIMPLYTYLWGETKVPAQVGAIPCFFMKDFVDFQDNHIHSMGRFLGSEQEKLFLPNRLEFALRHFSLYDMNKFVMSHLNYAKAEAQFKYKRGNKFSIFKLIKSMFGYFFLYYKKGFKNGKKGFLIAVAYSFFRFMTFFQLFELENNLNLESIEEKYVKEKNKLLEEQKQNI